MYKCDHGTTLRCSQCHAELVRLRERVGALEAAYKEARRIHDSKHETRLTMLHRPHGREDCTEEWFEFWRQAMKLDAFDAIGKAK